MSLHYLQGKGVCLKYILITRLSHSLNWKVTLQQSYKVNRLRTFVHSLLFPSRDARIAFIFGCQRSGTTLLRNFIGIDQRFRDIGEGDTPYFHQEHGDRYLRLKDDSSLEVLVRSQKSPWVLLKPLHDSQRASELLKRFPNSKGIWIYRHYQAVIQSHLTYYKHDPFRYLAPLVELDISSWILEGLPSNALDEIRELTTLARESAVDLYALFWYVRNRHLLAQISETPMLVLSYEDLVLKPDQSRMRLSNHFEVTLPASASSFPQQSSLIQKRVAKLHPRIRDACDELFLRINSLSEFLANQASTTKNVE